MKQRIRLGIPALFYFLAKNGYDIWVYAADYYSIDDIQKFFRAYSVHVDGIITGVAKRDQNQTESALRMEKLIANKYKKTLHIDNDLILVTRGRTGEFEEFQIDSSEEEWAKKAISVIEEMEKNESKR